MTEWIGEFDEPREDKGLENLVLRFQPSSIPLQQRWRNNGLSADFLADYVTTFYPKTPEDPGSAARQEEIKGAVSYIANELLENAMKYSLHAHPILIHLQLEQDRLIFNETNTVDGERAQRFRAFIQRLREHDAGELFLRQMEANAEEGGASGLGLLTMINDYAARLSWKFEAGENGAVVITTQVQLDI